MATATGKKTLCSTCQKVAGILTCRGCAKDFCYRHVAEHRQELNKQMDEVVTNHDQLQQTIVEQESQPNCHPLMGKIDAWEQQSIDKIHQAADNARKQILTILGTFRTQVAHDLVSLTTELNQARNEDGYDETDLKEWTRKLDELKIDLNAAEIMDFNQDDNETSLIPKIFIKDASTDIFYQATGNIQISEGGKLVTHGPTNQLAAARCRGDYSLGQHRFHFKIEQLSPMNGFSCGIVSKTVLVDSIINTTANYIYASGQNSFGTYNVFNHNILSRFNEQNHNFQINGTYEVLVDCNRKMMRLTNEQSGTTQELNINITACPFPWQFFITLLYCNDRVRLC